MPEYRDETGRVRNRDMEYSFLAAPRPPGGGVPQGGGAQTPGLPLLPTSLSNLQLKAGSRQALDPVALKLGYFPLPFVEKYLAEVVALQQQVQGLQSSLQGVQSRITAANNWVSSAVSSAQGLTGKAYTGTSFDSIGAIPADLVELGKQIQALEQQVDPLNLYHLKIQDMFGGNALTVLQQLLTALSGTISGLTSRITSANGVLTGILNNATLLTGNTYSPTSFDAVGLSQIGTDLGNLASALGPSGIGGTVEGWTGFAYQPKDLISGKLLGDLKTWVQGSLTNDVVSLENLVQRVYGVAAQSARDFIGLAMLHGFNPTHQVVKSQDTLQAGASRDSWGEMQQDGDDTELPEAGGFDGWDGDGLNINANPWAPTQFDAQGEVRQMGVLGFLLSKPFERARQTAAMRRTFDALPSGISTGDYGQDLIINWGDGNSEHNMSGPTHIFGAGTFTPSIQPLVKDNRTGRWYGRGILHNLKTYKFGGFPKSTTITDTGAVTMPDGTYWGNTRLIQVLDRRGQPLGGGGESINVRVTMRDGRGQRLSYKLPTGNLEWPPGSGSIYQSATWIGWNGGQTPFKVHAIPLRNPLAAAESTS